MIFVSSLVSVSDVTENSNAHVLYKESHGKANKQTPPFPPPPACATDAVFFSVPTITYSPDRLHAKEVTSGMRSFNGLSATIRPFRVHARKVCDSLSHAIMIPSGVMTFIYPLRAETFVRTSFVIRRKMDVPFVFEVATITFKSAETETASILAPCPR